SSRASQQPVTNPTVAMENTETRGRTEPGTPLERPSAPMMDAGKPTPSSRLLMSSTNAALMSPLRTSRNPSSRTEKTGKSVLMTWTNMGRLLLITGNTPPCELQMKLNPPNSDRMSLELHEHREVVRGQAGLEVAELHFAGKVAGLAFL